jgi:ATP/maltotriose-dependent transcriptional regulator MalT
VTRGWLVAVVLFAATSRNRPPARVLEGMASARGAVADYLGVQVLDLLGAESVSQLECAAALEPFDADLLEHVTEARCARTLELAEAHYLIVEEPTGAYRFPGLVGELLRDRLRRSPERGRSVHRRAGAMHLARGDLERALHHVLEAGDTDDAVSLLVTVGFAALTTNRVRAVGRYLDRLPSDVVDASLPLRFCRATVRMMRFETTSGVGDFRAVAEAEDLPTLAAGARARLAYFATWQGRFEEAARMARRALEVAPPLPDGVAVYAHSFLEIALRHLGRDAEADVIAEALDAAELPFPTSGIPPPSPVASRVSCAANTSVSSSSRSGGSIGSSARARRSGSPPSTCSLPGRRRSSGVSARRSSAPSEASTYARRTSRRGGRATSG